MSVAWGTWYLPHFCRSCKAHSFSIHQVSNSLELQKAQSRMEPSGVCLCTLLRPLKVLELSAELSAVPLELEF